MKARRNTMILLLGLVLTAAIVAILLLRDSSSTFGADDKAFATPDTAALTKIFMADKSGRKVTIERDGTGAPWMVNGKYTVDLSKLAILFETLEGVRIKLPVAPSMRETAMRNLAASGVKVELYENGHSKPDLVYYVGGSTPDELGTFMLLDGEEDPYITHIPGFAGYLSVRYAVAPTIWRGRELMRFPIGDITRVELHTPPSVLGGGYRVALQGNQFVGNRPGGEPQPLSDASSKALYASFLSMEFEGIEPRGNADSVKKSSPYAVVIVDHKGKEDRLSLYRRMARQGTKAIDTLTNTDLERSLGIMNNDNEVLLIQNRQLQGILLPFEAFTK